MRGGWDEKKSDKINLPCSIHTDGYGLTLHDKHIGGHPEWAEGILLIVRQADNQIFYDVDKKKVVEQLGTPEMFPKPEGDISLSPNADLFVNRYKIIIITPFIAGATAPLSVAKGSTKDHIAVTFASTLLHAGTGPMMRSLYPVSPRTRPGRGM